VRVRLRENGPLLLEDDEVTIVDWNGQPYEIRKRPVALCRCGGSASKPFCDGTHRKIGFKADNRADENAEARRQNTE
jgi:CDGSH-type Zn-finger protein